MAKLFNLARMTTATAGTGTITLGSAVSGFLTFALAGVANGDVVDYAIKDGANSEIGTATYSTSGPSLTGRTVTKSTNSNAAINLSGTAEVFISPRAETLITAVKRQVFTASGTYTPSAGMLYCVIECVGGGGGGGSAAGTSAQSYGGGGGGSGSCSRLVAMAATIGASQIVTIGAGGNGGAAGSNNGSAGNDTSVGSLCIGKGGSPGNYGSSAQVGSAGAGGVAGTGDLAAVGGPGLPGLFSNSSNIVLASGAGGSSAFGGGARGVYVAGAATAGNNGGAYGGGGSGAQAHNTTGNAAGGNGAAGVVVVTEYCSVV